jgi:hypothetical protein
MKSPLSALLAELRACEQVEVSLLARLKRAVKTTRDVRYLVDRLRTSDKAIVARTVSYLVAKKVGEWRAAELAPAVCLLLAKVRKTGDVGTLENCLTALTEVVLTECGVSRLASYRELLYDFLRKCLARSVDPNIKAGAVEVISLLFHKGVLSEVFSDAQVAAIRESVAKLQSSTEESVRVTLGELEGFAAEQVGATNDEPTTYDWAVTGKRWGRDIRGMSSSDVRYALAL